MPASATARRSTGAIVATCWRDATSGTTPPYSACTRICDATTSERTRRPSSTTAAAVSSHDVSIPRTKTPSTPAERGPRLPAAPPKRPPVPVALPHHPRGEPPPHAPDSVLASFAAVHAVVASRILPWLKPGIFQQLGKIRVAIVAATPPPPLWRPPPRPAGPILEVAASAGAGGEEGRSRRSEAPAFFASRRGGTAEQFRRWRRPLLSPAGATAAGATAGALLTRSGHRCWRRRLGGGAAGTSGCGRQRDRLAGAEWMAASLVSRT